MRAEGRKAKELRPLRITPAYIKTADGSVLIEIGDTRVICTAKLEERAPAFLRNSGQGWITAEWKPSENNRRAKYYSLTRLGRRALERETANWERLSGAITQVVKLEEA